MNFKLQLLRLRTERMGWALCCRPMGCNWSVWALSFNGPHRPTRVPWMLLVNTSELCRLQLEIWTTGTRRRWILKTIAWFVRWATRSPFKMAPTFGMQTNIAINSTKLAERSVRWCHVSVVALFSNFQGGETWKAVKHFPLRVKLHAMNLGFILWHTFLFHHLTWMLHVSETRPSWNSLPFPADGSRVGIYPKWLRWLLWKELIALWQLSTSCGLAWRLDLSCRLCTYIYIYEIYIYMIYIYMRTIYIYIWYKSISLMYKCNIVQYHRVRLRKYRLSRSCPRFETCGNTSFRCDSRNPFILVLLHWNNSMSYRIWATAKI